MQFSKEEKVLELIEQTIKKIHSENDLNWINDGVKFEDYVTDVMKDLATTLEITIEQTGKQSFPDIIIDKTYGLEVKYTSKTKWNSTGNSIFEGTRRKDVTDQIYLLFGRKVDNKIETRFKKYEDCLSDIKVTHSPRFTIDMEIADGDDILNTIGITYDTFKVLPDTVKSEKLKEFVRGTLSEGETLWWLDNINEDVISPKIINLSSLNSKDLEKIIVESFILFPEIFSSSRTKYFNLSAYLMKEYQIVSSSLRDIFSAGGKGNITLYGTSISSAQIDYKLYLYANEINEALKEISLDKLKEHWPNELIINKNLNETNKLDCWKYLLDYYSQKIDLKSSSNNYVLSDASKKILASQVFEEGIKYQ